MSIRCPDCQRHAQFVAAMDVPPDASWDEIELELYECHCGFHGVTVSCEAGRARPSGETVHHYGLRLRPDTARAIAALIQDCDDPSNRTCRCDAHLRLGRQEAGKWSGLAEWGADKGFRIDHVHG